VRPPEGSGIIAQQQAERSFRNNKLSTARGPRNIAQQQAEHRNKLRGASDLERRRCYPRMLGSVTVRLRGFRATSTNLDQLGSIWINNKFASTDLGEVMDPFGKP